MKTPPWQNCDALQGVHTMSSTYTSWKAFVNATATVKIKAIHWSFIEYVRYWLYKIYDTVRTSLVRVHIYMSVS